MTIKPKPQSSLGVQELCRKLKEQLDGLAVTIEIDRSMSDSEKGQRKELMEKLRQQLLELSN